MRFTLWVETTDGADADAAEQIATQQMADFGVRLAAMAHVYEAFTMTVKARPTYDMPGTWLVDVELPERES